jgi:alpha-glucosidase
MPWTADGPSFGFGPGGDTWLPQPEVYGELAVDRQDGVPGSTLELYRALLRLRRERDLAAGSVAQVETPEGVLAYVVTSRSGTRTGLVLNESGEPAKVPFEGRLLVHSAPEIDPATGRADVLPADTAAWLALD